MIIMPTKADHKRLLEDLQARFPGLAERINRDRAAILDAWGLVQKCNAGKLTDRKTRQALTTMVEAGLVPTKIIKFFSDQLVDPPATREDLAELGYIAQHIARRMPGADTNVLRRTVGRHPTISAMLAAGRVTNSDIDKAVLRAEGVPPPPEAPSVEAPYPSEGGGGAGGRGGGGGGQDEHEISITVTAPETVEAEKDFEIKVDVKGPQPWVALQVFVDEKPIPGGRLGSANPHATLTIPKAKIKEPGDHWIYAQGRPVGERDVVPSVEVKITVLPTRVARVRPPEKPYKLGAVAEKTWAKMPGFAGDRLMRAMHAGRRELDRAAREWYEDKAAGLLADLKALKTSLDKMDSQLGKEIAAGREEAKLKEQFREALGAGDAANLFGGEAGAADLGKIADVVEKLAASQTTAKGSLIAMQIRDLQAKLGEKNTYVERGFQTDLQKYLVEESGKVLGDIAVNLGIENESDRALLEKDFKGEAAWLAGYYARALKKQKLKGYSRFLHRLGRKSTEHIGAMKATDVLKEFMTEWWGLWLWPLMLAFGFGDVAWVQFIIWGIMKIPLVAGIGVFWLQYSLLLGGAIFGLSFLSLPGYATAGAAAADPLNIWMLAVVGGFVNWLFNLGKLDRHQGKIFEGTQLGVLVGTLNHFVGGAIVYVGVYMFMLALQLPALAPTAPAIVYGIIGGSVIMFLFTFMGINPMAIPLIMLIVAFFVQPLAAVIIFLLFAIVGITHFYSQGGLPAVNVLALLVLAFSFLALGPFSGTVVNAVDSVSTPVQLVWTSVSDAFSDVWLLLTNPTEYYARQQLRAARPERPVAFPGAAEITSLQTVPTGTVPSGERFVVFATLENKLDRPVGNVTTWGYCEGIGGLPVCEGTVDIERFKTDAQAAGLSEAAIQNITAGILFGLGGVHGIDEMRPGEFDRADFTFIAKGREEARAAEVVFNKVVLTMRGVYTTDSSLQTEIATRDEVFRRQTTRTGRLYYPEVAVAKVGPAQLGISAGPQPLIAGTRAPFIVSISNTRPDGRIILDASSLTIRVPDFVGKNVACRDVACTSADGASTCAITLDHTVLREYEKLDVVPIFCTMDIPEDEALATAGSRTGLITAELSRYDFYHEKEVRVPVGPRLGTLQTREQLQGQ